MSKVHTFKRRSDKGETMHIADKTRRVIGGKELAKRALSKDSRFSGIGQKADIKWAINNPGKRAVVKSGRYSVIIPELSDTKLTSVEIRELMIAI